MTTFKDVGKWTIEMEIQFGPMGKPKPIPGKKGYSSRRMPVKFGGVLKPTKK